METSSANNINNDRITIWTTTPLRSSVTVTKRVFQDEQIVGGLVRFYRTEKRLCTNSKKVKSSIVFPACPMDLSEESFSGGKPLTLILVPNDITRNILSAHDTIVTYFNGNSTVRIPFEVDDCTSYPLLSTCGRGIQCPQQEADVMYYFDTTDGICKPMNVTTRKPLLPWLGPCSCESTCFTPKALLPTWPFANETIRRSFKESMWSTRRPFGLKNERLRQTFDTHYSSACAAIETRSHNDSLIPDYLHISISGYIIVLPEARLLFCGIPKVGMTEWLKFFRYTLGARDYLSHPHFKTDLQEFHLARLSNAYIANILTDPTWTKAVFFRDPAERLLAAYSDKVQQDRFNRDVFRMGKETDDDYILNFTEFVNLVINRNEQNSASGLHWKTDPHWAPQILTAGLDRIFPFFDFVGNFDHVALHSKLLLQQVGLWHKWGSTFDSTPGQGGQTCAQPPPIQSSNRTTTLGFNQNGASDKAYKDSTGLRSKIQRYYTPELLAQVQKAYALDYEVWNEIKDRDRMDVSAAYNLKHVKERCKQQ
jgi:Sulfotransferase family